MHAADDDASLPTRTHSRKFAYRSTHASQLILKSDEVVFFQKLCSFCPRKLRIERNQKNSSSIQRFNDQHQLNERFPSTHQHKQWELWILWSFSNTRTHCNITQLWSNTGETSQACTSNAATFYDGFINIITCVGVCRCCPINCYIGWCSSGSTTYQASKKIAELQIVVRILCVFSFTWCVECDALAVSVTLKWPWIHRG